jgi:hypothetical protein
MTIEKSLFGTTRKIPEQGERFWGPDVTDILVDLIAGANGTLTQIGTIVVPALPSTNTTLAASATLTPTYPVHRVSGSGGAVTLDATTAIADGSVNGQKLIVRGTSATNFVTIPDGANTDLNGDMILEQYHQIELIWSTSASAWIELARNA